MAIAVHLVEKTSVLPRDQVLDGIQAVILAIDDTVETTGALIQAAADDACAAAGHNIPAGYFNTNRLIGIGTGVWDADDDISIINGHVMTEVIAS